MAMKLHSSKPPPLPKTAHAWAEVVDPDLFLAVEDLELVARGVVEGFMEGRHRSPFIGFSVEFDSHRDYQPGDDIRYVNWKVWARQDRLYVKRFNADTNLNLQLLLDVSGSMACDHGPSTKWRYATRAAAALAHLALRGRDATGLTLLGDGVTLHLPPKTHSEQLHQLVAALGQATPGGQAHLGRALDEAVKLCRRRGLVILISDMMDSETDIFAGLDAFLYHGHEVLVLQLLDPWERNLPTEGQYRFQDLESNEWIEADVRTIQAAYHDGVRDWLETVRRACEDRGIDWICCTTADPLQDILVDYLAKRAHLMG